MSVVETKGASIIELGSIPTLAPVHYIFQFRVAAFIENYRGNSLDDDGDRTITSEGHGRFIADPRVTSHKQVVEKIRDEIANWKKLGKTYRVNPRITILIFALHVRDSEVNDDEDGYAFIYNEAAELKKSIELVKNIELAKSTELLKSIELVKSMEVQEPGRVATTTVSSTIPPERILADNGKSGVATCRHWAAFTSGQISSNCRFGERCRFKHAR